MVLERQYVIPLRKEWLKVPKYKRAKKGIKAVKEFIAKHMKTDMNNVKLSRWVNENVWGRGIKSPPGKIKIKAVKDDKNIVHVELFELSEKAKKFEEKESKRKTVITDKKKAEETKRKEAEEKAKAETEKQVQEATKNLDEKIREEKAKDAEVSAEKYKKEEKMLEHESHAHKEHSHAEPRKDHPHNKAQSKHPVRQTLEK
ncbi:MAG: 50S ribosomal protein L31e [Nanoarchaeota archaeon]|nr:50S ribosomal protein L31e [Nanoarchaeota archaeon]